MKINILGSKWKIINASEEDDPKLEDIAGYADYTVREIKIKKLVQDNYSVADLEMHTKKVLRHEIVHAFFYESGLDVNSNDSSAWARNEEMVDWIAFQGPKLHKAWRDADAL